MSLVSRLAVIVLGLVVCAASESREFRLGLITPANHVWTNTAESFAAALDEATDGHHTVSVFPAQQLGNEAQILQQLQTGAVDFAFLTVAEVSNRVSDFGAFYAPYLVSDIEGAAALLRSRVAIDMLDQLPAKIGVFGIAYGTAGMRQVLAKSDVDTMSDLRGQKLRITPFAPIRDFYRLVGAAPTPMPLASVYDALANGQVDAIDMDLETILKLRYHELADTLLLTDHMMFPMVALVSARVWVRLDADEQALLKTLLQTELDRMLVRYVVEERRYRQQIKSVGIRIVTPNADDVGAVVRQWDALWNERTPIVQALRRQMRENSQ